MEFRPCIDIHNGKVKQIVGGTLNDSGAKENFVAEQDSGYFARYYKDLGIRGGHIIMLNRAGTEEYEASREAALKALKAYPGGLQVGGGINAENAGSFIEAGASHVIVTSYVFSEGRINYENLEKLVAAVGREHVVLDLSCRKKGGDYYIVTDRWQKFTRTKLSAGLLTKLEKYCSEYLIHAVDVEVFGRIAVIGKHKVAEIHSLAPRFDDTPFLYKTQEKMYKMQFQAPTPCYNGSRNRFKSRRRF